MGVRGPVPKRSEDRRRRNKPDGVGLERVVVPESGEGGFVPPEPDGDWHPIARRVWDSALVSGQRVFYEASDWAVLFSLCDDLSYYKFGKKRSGQMLQSIMSGLGNLLLTEGERRRVQIELAKADGSGGEMSPGDQEVEAWRKELEKPHLRVV